jgi:hypothetical protein
MFASIIIKLKKISTDFIFPALSITFQSTAPRSGNYLLPNEAKRAAGMTDEQYKAANQAAMDRMTRGPMVW